ncbi:MAG: trimethylamine methyltransferase family protein [Acidimicrobiaceae bacterium]|nr:trimethylamine methyltransferase family protein [Acidimicrobiaceae bacterium]
MSERRRRAGGRRERPTGAVAPPQRPWQLYRRPIEPTRVVSDDELESIHLASLEVLSTVGMDFLHPKAIKLWTKAGARVDGDRVRFDPELVLELISTVPPEFTMHAPDPQYDLQIGGDNVVFTSVASAPNYADRAGGRRTGNREDFRTLLKLCQQLNIIQSHAGYPVEPVDVHASIRHLEATRDILTLSPKAVSVYSLGAQRNVDCLEMVRIVRGISDDEIDTHPIVHSVINVSSPLRLDTPMLEGILQYSARNQVIIITPFTLAGAMAPVTVAGAVVQQNAEALAGIAFTQLVRSGAPTIYGGFTSNVDMQSGAPAFGTPEYIQSAMLGGQLARRYGFPYRSSNVCAANTIDVQAGYESAFALWGAIMGGANMVFHGAGWMEGGLHASPEKMVIDADLLQMVATFLQPLVVDDATLALDAIAEVGPGGHHFGTQHTQDRYRDAFYRPMISDWRNFETWDEAGRPTSYDHAERVMNELLATYEQPHMDDAVRAELDDFVDRRIAEGGIPTDF